MSVLVLGVLVVQYQQYRVLKEVAIGMADVPNKSLVTKWKSGGQVIVVMTEKQSVTETDAELLARHTQRISEELQTHPIDN